MVADSREPRSSSILTGTRTTWSRFFASTDRSPVVPSSSPTHCSRWMASWLRLLTSRASRVLSTPDCWLTRRTHLVSSARAVGASLPPQASNPMWWSARSASRSGWRAPSWQPVTLSCPSSATELAASSIRLRHPPLSRARRSPHCNWSEKQTPPAGRCCPTPACYARSSTDSALKSRLEIVRFCLF